MPASSSNDKSNIEGDTKLNRAAKFFGCFFGLTASFSLHAHIMERITTEESASDIQIMLVTTGIYAIMAFALVGCFEKKQSAKELVLDVQETTDSSLKSHHTLLFKCFFVSLTTFGSTFLAIMALHYITYPTKVLGKICKPLPVLIIGKCFFKKTYSAKKYVSLAFILSGAAIFFLMQSSTDTNNKHDRNSIEGILLLAASLVLDGLTGVLQDNCIEIHGIGPLTLMYYINRVSFIIALVGCYISHGPSFVQQIHESPSLDWLLALGCAGGLGHVFIFVTISRYGALMTSVISSGRKMLTIVLSIAYFGHELNIWQAFGIVLTATGMGVNSMAKKKKLKVRPDETAIDGTPSCHSPPKSFPSSLVIDTDKI